MHQDTRRYLAAAVLLLVGAGLTQATRTVREAEAHYEADFSRVPLVIGEYEGERRPVDESIFAYLEAAAMEERIYTGPDGWVRLALVYGTDWRSVHAPTGCFPAQGWHIMHNRTVDLPAPPGSPHPGPVQVRVLDVTRDEARLLAMFAYARPGGTTADWTLHGWRVATGPRGAGGMIIILQSAVQDGNARAVEETLARFMAEIYPRAVSFWYEGQPHAEAGGTRSDAGGRITGGLP